MITLIGHGYVGKYIKKELEKQVIKHEWIDHETQPTLTTKVIINAGGFTGVPNVDACESQKDKTIDGNVLFPLRLSRWAELRNIPIVHISSGCVYTGYKDGGWTEEDAPNFTFDNASFYSATKSLNQEILKPYLKQSYLLRIRMPFGPDTDDKNLLTKLSKYNKLVNFENSVSNVEEVAECAVWFAENKPMPGIYNAVNPGGLKTHQIAQMMGLTKAYFTDEEFKQAVIAPRSNCVLNTDKMQKVFQFRNATESLIDSIAKIKKL
jgi:UDP-glucose 4,6-dehydratase